MSSLSRKYFFNMMILLFISSQGLPSTVLHDDNTKIIQEKKPLGIPRLFFLHGRRRALLYFIHTVYHRKTLPPLKIPYENNEPGWNQLCGSGSALWETCWIRIQEPNIAEYLRKSAENFVHIQDFFSRYNNNLKSHEKQHLIFSI